MMESESCLSFPINSCVALGKIYFSPVPQFSNLYIEYNNSVVVKIRVTLE